MDGYSFSADDDEAMMPAGRVERRGGDHLSDFIPDDLEDKVDAFLGLGAYGPAPGNASQRFPDYDSEGTFLTMKDDELPEIRFPYEPQ